MCFDEHAPHSRIKIVSEDIVEQHTRQSLIELRVCQRGDEEEKGREMKGEDEKHAAAHWI